MLPAPSKSKKKVQYYFDDNVGQYDASENLIKAWIMQLRFIRKYVTAGQRFLDIGCNNALMSDIVLKELRVKEYVGVDVSEKSMIENRGKSNVTLIQADVAGGLPFESDSFEFVHASTLLHHLIGKNRSESTLLALKALQEMCRVTSGKGYVILSDVYYESRFIPVLAPYLIFYLLKVLPSSISKNLEVCFQTSKGYEEMVRKCAREIILQFKSKTQDKFISAENILLSGRGYVHFIFQKKEV